MAWMVISVPVRPTPALQTQRERDRERDRESKRIRLPLPLPTPAVDDVRTLCGSLEVVESPDEGEDWVRVVWDAKVWPAGVVELLHLSSLSSLSQTEREREGGRGRENERKGVCVK